MNLESILGLGKRAVSISAVVGTLALGSLFTECSSNRSESNGTSTTQAPGISEALQYEWPIWELSDLEINKYLNTSNSPAAIYDRELNLRPKFYFGSMPLNYKSVSIMGAGFMDAPSKTLQHEFEDFSNYFIYDGFMLKGVVSVNNHKDMVAEARINYSIENQLQKIEMEEFHYAKGLLVFHCLSQVDADTGMKISENDCSGKKHNDYFFILPFGINQ